MDESVRIGIYDELRAKRDRYVASASPAVVRRILGQKTPVAPLKTPETPIREPSVRYTQAEVDKMIAAAVQKESDRHAAQIEAERLSQLALGPSVGEILAAISAATEYKRDDLVGPKQFKSVTRARMIAYYLLRRLRPDLSLPVIGKALGGRDHTTIISGVRRFNIDRSIPPLSTWLEHEALRPLIAKADGK